MYYYKKKYDVIIVGAGHAGCEAAIAASKMHCKVLLLAIDIDKLAAMPCSPSIGGTAKGQLVKEIDAMGGEMARISDRSAIQYKTLNTKKGPAVHSTRTQNDKYIYHQEMKKVIEALGNIDIKQTIVDRLIVEGDRVAGVVDFTGFAFSGEAIVIATGTFLGGLIHIGDTRFKAGRAGEFASYALADNLRLLGFETGRMKTGTPPRLDRNTIDFSKFTKHAADTDCRPFAFNGRKSELPALPSYIGRTNKRSRQIVIDNLDRSPLYCGTIQGKSARYCPSFEDKAVKFPDRESHQIILEPEGIHSSEIYASGLGNSLPMDIQVMFVHSVDGLEEAEIIRPAYAIEYDYINPLQLGPTLASKKLDRLFFAGQVNGTSGYEEAAAQGLMAGINAALKVHGAPPFILDRSEAYIGVMIDDLVTRGTSEPYRMFTSRAEYRLLLREDNACIRLTEKARKLGLVDQKRYDTIQEIQASIGHEIQRIRQHIVKPSPEVNTFLTSKGSAPIKTGVHLDQILKRAGMTYNTAVETLGKRDTPIDEHTAQQVEIEVKYEGYMKRQISEVEKFKSLEKIKIPADIDYETIHGLSNELKGKLDKIRPVSLGQASRIEGMTPAALSVMMVVIKKK